MDKTDSPLARYLAKSGESQAAFAARAGVSAQALSNWIHGTRRPDVAGALAIASATDSAVPVETWARKRRPSRVKRRRLPSAKAV